MMFQRYTHLVDDALAGLAPSRETARWIMDGEDVQLLALLQAAYVPRVQHFGKLVKVHILNNVQNGRCQEDCGYCSQSKDSDAPIEAYPMKTDEQIFAEAEQAAKNGASRYCMVLSGRGPSMERTKKLAGLIKGVKDKYPVEVCLSVGLIDDEKAQMLSDAGLDRLNHNLNTSERMYKDICTTHTYQDRINTIVSAKKAGMSSCSGLIVGMNETTDDIIDVAMKLRELEVPSIPVNFLIPIEGNPMYSDHTLTPEKCLRALCLLRLINPAAEIRAAAGREGHLKALQPLAYWPANSIFVDGYLTTRGSDMANTYRMIRESGFEVEGNELYEAEGGEAQAYRVDDTALPILKPEVSRKSACVPS
ncbi:MAG TPA: biotin synthase BioB [Phycisphaerales bacterium]|nr:biotin synthase BioB [Phycisphaerales bacterium]HCD31055.1 biotin synthase BioB [Phycisphaerales bacterium]|tara:strand:+ start:26524 stop:27612 length:1089 start_codon:yes stop_codon:yes gene_type:complete